MAKSTAKEPRKKVSTRARPRISPLERIENASVEALEKLRALGIHESLQRDLEWCLGSYKADNNPVGLYEMTERALAIFKKERDKKTKGVTAKLIDNLERALKNR